MQGFYWTPRYKWQLVDWISQHTHTRKYKWERLRQIQLYAIYHKLRNN